MLPRLHAFLHPEDLIEHLGAEDDTLVAIAKFIDEHPKRFETWYIAGNGIDAPSFGILADAIVKSPVITNVWLKRNPLGPSAAIDVFRLITQSPSLRTPDLDQTALGDSGIAELFSLLAEHTEANPVALRKLHLHACGIGYKVCTQISHFLASTHCSLEAL